MILKRIRTFFLYVLNLPLYWISELVSKDENIWIFGAWFGDKYADNSKYLFEYVNKNHPNIRAIWLTKNKSVYDLVQSKDYEVYYKYSLKSILFGLRAKYSIFVQSNNADNMLFLNNSKTKQIQLWHGTPLKKIGFDVDFNQSKLSNLKLSLFPFLNNKLDFMISMSDKDKINFNTAFNVEKIQITGYPRNDSLLTKKKKKIFEVTYLPTFRDNIGDKIDLFSDYNFDIEKWDKKLSELNIKLNIKMHPVNKPTDDLLKKFNTFKNIIFLDEIDVSDILPTTDILITDYSSVYFDFLLTDKPIIFAPFDYEKYIIKDRELYYNYDEVTPGPKCQDWDEVLNWMLKFKENLEPYKIERATVKNMFHNYQDANSCERVFNEIIKLEGKVNSSNYELKVKNEK
jgi:CDP-glycerol glycerophosphotransferase